MAVKKSFSETVKAVLLKENENAGTLKPGSKEKEPMHVLDKGKVPDTEDQQDLIPDATPDAASGTKTGGQKVSTSAKKDTSKSSKSPNPGEKFNPTGREYGKQPQAETSPGVKASGEPGSGPQKLSGTPLKPSKSTQNKDGVNEEDEMPDTIDLDALVESMIEDGLNEEEIEEALDAILEDYDLVEETLDEETLDEEEDLPSVEIPEMEIDVTEDVKAMFEGETFSEDFQAKAKLIFETAIRTRLEKYQSQLDEAFAKALVESTEDISKTLSENVEDYLGYVVDQWMTENEVAIEPRLTTEWTQEFMIGLRNLMIENHIDIPEEKIDLVEELAAKVKELEASLNEEIENNVTLSKAINEAAKWDIFDQVTDGLVATQVEKLKGLVENVDFDDEESFGNKVMTLKENYFPSNVKNTKTLEKEIVTEDDKKFLSEENTNSPMNKYVKTIGRIAKNV